VWQVEAKGRGEGGGVGGGKKNKRRVGQVRAMLLVELFRGTGSVGKVARRRGWTVLSVDIDPSHGATYAIDVRRLAYKELPVPDFVWASPPCTTYSQAANWVRHREPGTGRALSRDAHEADSIVRHTLKMIRYWRQRNPALRFCIENPRGHLRQLPEMQGLTRTTTHYSYYGWPIAKPTDFWTNFPLRLKTSGPPGTLGVRVGSDPGWRKALDDAFGGHGHSQAVNLGRIPPALVGSILTQMADGGGGGRRRPSSPRGGGAASPQRGSRRPRHPSRSRPRASQRELSAKKSA